jgi:hypothetical protein
MLKQKKKNKQRSDYKRLNWFDVMDIMDNRKLIVPLKEGETKIIY